MIRYTIICLKKYAVFRGRARRAEYWYFFLATFLAGFTISIAGGVLGTMMLLSGNSLFWAMLALNAGNFITLCTILPSLAAGVRRLHDINKSGWWILVPLYNLYLFAQKGTEGANYYGPDPLIDPLPVPVPQPAQAVSTPMA